MATTSQHNHPLRTTILSNMHPFGKTSTRTTGVGMGGEGWGGVGWAQCPIAQTDPVDPKMAPRPMGPLPWGTGGPNEANLNNLYGLTTPPDQQ